MQNISTVGQVNELQKEWKFKFVFYSDKLIKVSGQLENWPRAIAPWMIAPCIIAPQTITAEVNCPWGKLPPGKLPTHHKVSLENNCPHQANSPQRVLRVNWGKLCIVNEYYNIRVLQLTSKNWFTSIYILHILTKPCRTPLIIEHLSLNTSWFSSARMQK